MSNLFAPEAVSQILEIAKDKNFTMDDLIEEAELLENEGEYIHMSLLGFSSDELRQAAFEMQVSGLETEIELD